MVLGTLEIVLLGAIVILLFGPKVVRIVKIYQDRIIKRSARLQKVAARRRAEQLARQEIRNAKIKMVSFSVLGACLISSVLYLSFWPVFVDVNSYQLTVDETYTSVSNAALDTVEGDTVLAIEGYQNITQVRFYDDWIYAAVEGGIIIRVRENDTALTEVLVTGGEIISFDFDAEGDIIFTDAAYDKDGGALLQASFDGFAITVTPLYTGLSSPTGVEVAEDGTIYFLDATSISAEKNGTLQAMRNAQIAHTQDGTLYAYDPMAGSCEVMVSGLGYAAGLALSQDENTLYITQFSDASVWEVAADTCGAVLGDDATSEFASGFAGYPSGVSVAEDGTVVVSIFCAQIGWFEKLSDNPAWRELLLRLPQGTREKLLSYKSGAGEVLTFAADGSFMESYQTDREKDIEMITSACMVSKRLYFAQANKNEWIGYVVY